MALQYFYWNHPTFSISWSCPKIHFTETVKKQNIKNLSIVNTNFNIQQMAWSTPVYFPKLIRKFCSKYAFILACEFLQSTKSDGEMACHFFWNKENEFTHQEAVAGCQNFKAELSTLPIEKSKKSIPVS